MTGPHICLSFTETADRSIDLPGYGSDGAAGLDVRANLPISERNEGLTLAPQARVLVPTGLRMAIPEGFEVQVRPRSGLALKNGVTVLNAPGTIDSDYRGEVGVILVNHGSVPFVVAHGDRIAQLVVATVTRATFMMTDNLDDTERGDGGFGSTGHR